MYNATLTGPAYVYTAPTPVFDIIDEPDVVDEVIVVPPDPLVFTEITGTAGNDVLPWNFSVGNAIIDGGDGFDTVAVDAYDSSSTTFSLNSSGGSVDLRVGGFILDISNVEALDIVGGSGTDSITVGNLDGTAITDNSVTFSGGGGNDILSGTYASKRLVAFGGQGDDTLITGSADDFLSGGEDADFLSGGAGADFLSGGAGNDSLYGGNGFDTMQVDEAQGAIVNFNTGTATGSEGNTDQFSSIESVIGSSYDDVFIASYSTGNLVIDGSGGDDTLAIYGNPSSGSTFVVEEFNGDVLIESSSQLITADGVEDLYQRREFLTRGGFPFCYGCDSRLAKEIRHVSMHCSSGRLRQHSASAPGQTLSRSTSGSAAFGLGGGLRRHEPRGSGEGWRHGPSDAERLGASLQ